MFSKEEVMILISKHKTGKHALLNLWESYFIEIVSLDRDLKLEKMNVIISNSKILNSKPILHISLTDVPKYLQMSGNDSYEVRS